jgi:hypothetical protein
LQNFVSVVPLAIFSKNARILTVIFIGHRQLDNTFFFIYPLLHTPLHLLFIKPFCLYNNSLFFLKKADQYYVLKEILYEILSLEASIQGEKIVNNNLQLDRLELLLNEVLIVVKITPTILFDSMT